MQSNQYNYGVNQQPRAAVMKRWLILILIVVILVFAGVFVYRQVAFRVSKTNPNMDRVATATAFIKIYFNKPITDQGLRLSYSSSFISKYTVHNNEIDLTTKDGALVSGKRYTITIDYVASTGGKEIRNKKLSFTAQNIPLDKISQDQQRALVNRQDQYPYSVQYVNYVGFDNLIQSGLSTDQLTALKQDLFGYSNQVNQKFWTVTLQPKTLVVQIHNAESASLDDTYSFQVQMGGATYNARVTSDPIDDTLQLQLSDASNNLVYDSNDAHD